MNKPLITQRIKQKAFDLGFSFVGVSRAEFLENEARDLEKWLSENRHGKMSYMENYFDKRTDPSLLVDNAKSVITVLQNYYSTSKQQDKNAPKISMYALGKDYHFVIRDKLNRLHNFIKDEIGDVNARGFVDSAPVMDKVWAEKSGLGWIGKHTNLINKKQGSYFFIGELIVDLELDYDGPIKDFCGTCTKCIDACPTNAIIQPYKLDASKCISYLTIELKDELFPKEFKGKMENWMFGCDICQEVCPWNKFSLQHKEPQFNPDLKLLQINKKQWDELSKETFNELFKKSAIKRTKFEGLKRNIKFLKNN
jgi:epoxyqueuosine reductase